MVRPTQLLGLNRFQDQGTSRMTLAATQAGPSADLSEALQPVEVLETKHGLEQRLFATAQP